MGSGSGLSTLRLSLPPMGQPRAQALSVGKVGSPGRTRTYNLAVNSRPLYRLSYRGMYTYGCGARIRTWTMGFKVPCATVTPLRKESTFLKSQGTFSIAVANRCIWCRRPDSNRHEGHPSTDFESAASTSSATSALVPPIIPWGVAI